MSETWECPTCQTLNVAGTSCYSCGAARPGVVASAPQAVPAIDWPVAEVDTEPHPCWCDLVKGPHDTRDHPDSAATELESAAGQEADAQLNGLEVELARMTNDWTVSQLQRSYDDGDDGEQDYEDEMLILDDHGYAKSVERHHGRIDATYTREDGEAGPLNWQAEPA